MFTGQFTAGGEGAAAEGGIAPAFPRRGRRSTGEGVFTLIIQKSS